MKNSTLFLLFICVVCQPFAFAGDLDPMQIKYPLQFTRNDGQWKGGVLYAVLQRSQRAELLRDGMIIWMDGGEELHMPHLESGLQMPNREVHLRFSNPLPTMSVEEYSKSESVSHFYFGADSMHWRENVPNFRGIRYRQVWENIDVEYEINGESLLQRIVLLPGARANDIRFLLEGENGKKEKLSTAFKNTVICSSGGTRRTGVTITQSGNMSFRNLPGVLHDTTYLETEFATHFGGSTGESITDVVVAPDGKIFVGGWTLSKDFPLHNQLQVYTHGNQSSGFVSGFSCNASTLLFSTYFGKVGDAYNSVRLAVDDSSGVFVSAYHNGDMPLSQNALVKERGQLYFGILANDGQLKYGSYMGMKVQLSSNWSTINRIQRAPDGTVYMLGSSTDTLFPPLSNQSIKAKVYSFIFRFNATCDTVLYGGINIYGDSTMISDLGIDPDGSVVLTGMTWEDKLPVTHDAWQVQRKGDTDAFLVRMTPMLDSVLYATYLGGTDTMRNYIAWNWGIGGDAGFQGSLLEVGENGNMTIAFDTRSTDMKLLTSSPPMVKPGEPSIAIAQFTREGRPVFITRHGGSGLEWLHDLDLTPCGRPVIVAGVTSADIPKVRNWPIYDSLSVQIPGGGPSHWPLLIAAFDTTGGVVLSTLWGEISVMGVSYDQHGYLLLGGISLPFIRPFNTFKPENGGAALARFYEPLCGEDFLSCSIDIPDSIVTDELRGYISTERFTLGLEIVNPDPFRVAENVECELRLPTGVVLDPDTGSLVHSVDVLRPGESIRYAWHVRFLPASVPDSLLEIAAYISFNNLGLSSSCLSSYSGCGSQIRIVHHQSLPLHIECQIVAPSRIVANAAGDGYEPVSFGVFASIMNRGKESVFPGEAVLRYGGMGLVAVPESDSVRALPTLAPGESIDMQWVARALPRAWHRDVELSVQLRDFMGEMPVSCTSEIAIDALPAPLCHIECIDTIWYDAATGGQEPSPFIVRTDFTNPFDTALVRVEAELDTSVFRALTLGQGEEVRKSISHISAGGSMERSWQLLLRDPSEDITLERVVVRSRPPGVSEWKECEEIVVVVRREGRLACVLLAPDSLVQQDSTYMVNPFSIGCRLTNTGDQRIETEYIALNISSEACVISMDPLTVPGVLLNPGETVNEQWRLQALASAYSRNAQLTVTAFDDRDSVLSQCVHTIFIPGIDGLRCLLTAPDTVRFDRVAVSYLPDPVPVFMDLRNVLDTLETSIEVEIDLTEASRFELDAGDTEGRSLALLESHSLAVFSWLLRPKAGDVTETQRIVVRYRSDAEAEWKQCETNIVVEAWQRITKTNCETGGHDSLYADDYHEQWIPDPISLSYKVTNTGTATLTNCRASIILPLEFNLAGSDIEQNYGTLTPGASAVRWWNVSPTMQLTEFKPYTIGWEWTSLEQGTQTGCDHTVYVVPGTSSGIVLTPLHLHFEAEYAGTLPASKQVQLWTGGGLPMPWTAQIGESWLDVQPSTGSQTTQLNVRPNTTLLPEGIYGTEISVNAQRISVTYLIDDVTDVTDPVQANSFRLDQNWPNPVSLTGSGTTITFHLDLSGRTVLKLYDVMGREVVTMLDADMEAGSHAVRFSPSDLTPGIYFYRLIGLETSAIRSMMVVR